MLLLTEPKTVSGQLRSLLNKTAVATPDERQIATLHLSCKFHAKSKKHFLAMPHAILIGQYRELLSTRLAHPITPAKHLYPLDIQCSKYDRRFEANGMNPQPYPLTNPGKSLPKSPPAISTGSYEHQKTRQRFSKHARRDRNH